MPKMTPEQEAAYALNFGVARSDLPPDAQLAYDRLAEQRAWAAASAPITPTDPRAISAFVTVPRWVAALGTAIFALIFQGAGVVLLPYAFTHWAHGTPMWPVVARAIGVALIAVGGIVTADLRGRVPGHYRLPRSPGRGPGSRPPFRPAICGLP